MHKCLLDNDFHVSKYRTVSFLAVHRDELMVFIKLSFPELEGKRLITRV